MYIVEKDGYGVHNIEFMTSIYIGNDFCTIKANLNSGTHIRLGRYSNPTEAETALKIIIENIGKTGIFYMPSEEQLKARYNRNKEVYHNIGGKKTKGHGGS